MSCLLGEWHNHPFACGTALTFFFASDKRLATLKIFLSYSSRPSASTPIPALKSGNLPRKSRIFAPRICFLPKNVCIQPSLTKGSSNMTRGPSVMSCVDFKAKGELGSMELFSQSNFFKGHLGVPLRGILGDYKP